MRFQQRIDHRRWSAQLRRGRRTMPTEQQGVRSYADQIGRLVSGCGQGDVTELGRLYDETIGWVYPMMCRVARGDPSSAATLTMNAYQRIWISSPVFDSTSECAVRWVMRQVRPQLIAIPNAGVDV